MSDAPRADPNADQIAFWNDEMGRRWVEHQNDIDVMFAPLTEALLARAAAQPGEHVLDVGCGCGTTVVELARRVGPRGSVLGVDVSAPMLQRAGERIAGLPNASIVRADATDHPFAPTGNLAFSRFGVMFFADPTTAFANIRGALVPGGRLVMAVWRSLAENVWAAVPLAAALPHLPAQPQADPEAPGMFAFANPDRVRAILEAAGFADVTLSPLDPPILMGGPGEAAVATARALRVGPTARAVAEAEPAVHAAVRASILEAFSRLERPDGLALAGAIWILSARRA